MAGRRAKPEDDIRLGDWWRGALSILGIALIAVGLLGWVYPPKHDQFAPQAKDKSGLANAPATSETLSSLLVGVGAVLLIIGANGRKLASIKVGDEEVTWATETAKKAGAKAKQEAAVAGLPAAKQRAAEALARSETYVQARTDPAELDTDAIVDAAVKAFE